MTAAAARALLPDLRIEPHRPDLDREAIDNLAARAFRFGPRVSIDTRPGGLFVDVTGTARHFGGEDGLARAARVLAFRSGFTARVAIAATPGAAFALARFGPAPAAVVPADPPGDPRRLAAALADLPPAALRLPGSAVEKLSSLGVVSVSALLRLPRTSIPSRFGTETLALIDRALGRVAEPLQPFHPPEILVERIEFAEPVRTTAALGFALKVLIDRVEEALLPRREGAHELVLRLHHGRDAVTAVSLPLTTPRIEARNLLHLLMARLERLHLPAPVLSLALEIPRTALLQTVRHDLFEETSGASEALESLLDRITARLGPAAVLRAALRADARPEAAFRLRHAADSGPAEPGPAPPGERPLRLFHAPVPLEGPPARSGFRLVTSPERIETGWWDGADLSRDYHVAENIEGARFWIFRDLASDEWYVHGSFE